MLSIPPAPPARKKKPLRARYQTNNQKSQAPTQTLEMYADTNTSPYRELFALARHTALFTNGLGNWWYISNIASHRLTPWTFLTSGEGNPVAFRKQSKHSAPLLCSTRIHIAAAAARFTAWMLFCFHCAPGPRRSQGVSLQIHTGKEEHFILGEKEKARSCPWGTPPPSQAYMICWLFLCPSSITLHRKKHDPRQQQLQWGFSRGLLGIKQRGLLVGTS